MKISSLALWYIPKESHDSGNPTDVEAHFNLWKIPAGSFWFRSRRLFKRYLDIGLRLNKADKIKALKLYVPFELKTGDLIDLGGRMRKPELLCAVFNDNLHIKAGNSDYYEIYNSDGALDFKIYKLDDSSFELDHNVERGATVVTIKLDYKDSEDLYIRFRILGDFAKTLSFIDKPPNSIFQSAFYRTDTIDFRLNEFRVLENKFVEKMKFESGRVFQFKKIHFFFICNSREEWFFSQLPYVNCRILESNKWDEYAEEVPSNKVKLNKKATKKKGAPPVMAYHWKSAPKNDKLVSDFNILIKTKFEQSDLITIGLFLLIGVALSLIPEMLGAAIDRWLYPEKETNPAVSVNNKPAVNLNNKKAADTSKAVNFIDSSHND